MTVQEFSDEFDTIISSYKRFKRLDDKEELDSVDINEYEKSVFLTKAQEDVIVDLYTGRNTLLNSFEETEELRRYLSSLIRTVSISPENTLTSNLSTCYDREVLLSDKSQVFNLPSDLWFITYEAAKLPSSSDSCLSGKTLEVIPVTQDEYHKIKNNPFRGVSSNRALRLDLANSKVEIISNYTLAEYIVRYIKKVSPIILIDLPEDLSINGISVETECTLHPALHRLILKRATDLAINSKFLNVKTS